MQLLVFHQSLFLSPPPALFNNNNDNGNNNNNDNGNNYNNDNNNNNNNNNDDYTNSRFRRENVQDIEPIDFKTYQMPVNKQGNHLFFMVDFN